MKSVGKDVDDDISTRLEQKFMQERDGGNLSELLWQPIVSQYQERFKYRRNVGPGLLFRIESQTKPSPRGLVILSMHRLSTLFYILGELQYHPRITE